MKAGNGRGVITLHGPPRKLTAVVRGLVSGRTVVPVTLKLPQESAVVRARIAPFSRVASEMRLQLPRETPPGTYRGESSVDGEPREIVVEVAPLAHLWVQPKRTVLAAEPGGQAELSIVLSNAGNVPVEMPRAAEVDLEDAEAQDRALGRALRAKLAEGERRVDRFFEELREAHGGAARLTVKRSLDILKPGQTCQLAARVDIPVTVHAGHTYSGVWQIGDANHLIGVEITRGPAGPARRGRRKS